MGFLKRTLVGGAAFFLIFGGGAGTQSQNTMLQGFGFIGLVVGVIALVVLIKMVGKAAGCLPSILIVGSLTLFVLYSIGAFSNGVTGVGERLSSFFGRKASISEQETQASANSGALNLLEEENFEGIGEGFSEPVGAQAPKAAPQPQQQPQQQPQPQPQAQKKGFLDSIVGAFGGGGQAQKQQQGFDPTRLPVIYGSAKVISGDSLRIQGINFRLFGIDAPEMNQSCSSAQGRAYQCGAASAKWLRDWIQDNELECRIMQQDQNGNMVGICMLGDYDIGAALVNAGWAVAYAKYSQIYVPYQMQAEQNRRGLWQGSFYMPWDWRNIQTKKPKIKIIKKKKKGVGLFSS